MVKNREIRARVNLKTEENFDNKCRALNLGRTQFIEKVSNEEIIFLDANTKKIIDLLLKKSKKQ